MHASERLSLTYLGKASRGKPRRKPELGNPTFRDCRGASGNVAMVELGTHFASESARLVTLHLQLGAPDFYPSAPNSRELLQSKAVVVNVHGQKA